MFCGCHEEHGGGMWIFVEKCGYNVHPPHLHISQFDQVLSPPWSVILKYAIVCVMWIHQISTLTIKWTADPFCRLYSSMHLLSVSWICIWSLYCTRALALLYNVSLEALKSYAFAKSLGLVSQDLNSSQRHNFIGSNILRLSKDLLVPPEDWKASEQLVTSRLAYYYILKRRNERSRLVNIFK